MDLFWSEDISILFNYPTYFFPSNSYSVVKNLNAIVRFLVYLSIILVLYTNNTRYLLLPVIGMVITFLIFRFYPLQEQLYITPESSPCNRTFKDKKNSRLRRKDKKCTKPTVDNPFMNFIHITDDYNREPACKAFLYDDKRSYGLKKDIKEKFNTKLYQDVSDIYNKRNSQREFYTVSYNGVPDQASFSKFLYKTPSTCKERGLNCAPHTGSLL